MESPHWLFYVYSWIKNAYIEPNIAHWALNTQYIRPKAAVKKWVYCKWSSGYIKSVTDEVDDLPAFNLHA